MNKLTLNQETLRRLNDRPRFGSNCGNTVDKSCDITCPSLPRPLTMMNERKV